MTDLEIESTFSANSNKNLQNKAEEINKQFHEREVKQQAKSHGYKYIDLKVVPVDQSTLRLMSWEEVLQWKTVPFYSKANTIYVASVDPGMDNMEQLLSQLESHGSSLQIYVCSEDGLMSMKKYYDQIEAINLANSSHEDLPHITDPVSSPQSVFDGKIWQIGSGPQMLNELNRVIVHDEISDIHFQPTETNVTLRFRKDGVLETITSLSLAQYQLFDAEIKRVSGMKINIKDLPQDGQYTIDAFNKNNTNKNGKSKVNIRVSSLPSRFGQSLVLRVLDQNKKQLGLSEMGFLPQQRDVILRSLQRQQGLVLVVGPTGSGKSTTLYACLQQLDKPSVKIITLEDPVEYEIPTLIQSEIRPDKNYTFSSGLRAILRHDPDIIMVGEIRDQETAEIALQAAMTGHIVLSSFHANSALSALQRLVHMGIKPFIVTAGLQCLIAQRLVRKLVESTGKMVSLTALEKSRVEALHKELQNKGLITKDEPVITHKIINGQFSGRFALAEVLELDADFQLALVNQKNTKELDDLTKKKGCISLAESAYLAVYKRKTTLDEVWGMLL